MKPGNLILLAVVGAGIWWLMQQQKKKEDEEVLELIQFSDLPQRRGTV